SSVVPDDVPMKEEDDKDEDTDDAKALEEYQQLKKMQEEMEGYIEENSLADTLGTALTAEGLLVTVRTDITFDSGSYTVKREGEDIFKNIADMIDTNPIYEIVVNGYADDRAINND